MPGEAQRKLQKEAEEGGDGNDRMAPSPSLREQRGCVLSVSRTVAQSGLLRNFAGAGALKRLGGDGRAGTIVRP
jgi:hypothetical protein